MVMRSGPRVVFVTPPVPDWVVAPMPLLGPAVLKGYLRSRGHESDLVDLSVRVRHANRFRWRRELDLRPMYDAVRLKTHLEGRHDPEIASLTERFIRMGNLDRYDVVGFSICLDQSIAPMLCIAHRLKRARRPPKVIVGGPVFERSDFRYLFEFECIDAIVNGDGEEAMRWIVEGGDEPVPGLERRGDGGVPTFSAPAYVPLEEKACPVFDADDIARYRALGLKGGVWLPYLLTRGCRYRCSFCRDYSNVKFTYTPTEKLVDDLARLQRAYGVDSIYFGESNMNNSGEEVRAMCEALLARDLRVTWGGLGTISGLDPDTIALMGAAGCKHLHIGLETGSERLREKWNIGKCRDLSEIRRRLALMHEHGIRVNSLWILAFPHETDAEHAESVEFFQDIAPYLTTVGASGFDLIEGSPAYMRQSVFGVSARPWKPGRYRFLDRHVAYDETGGASWEVKQREGDSKLSSFMRMARLRVGLPLALRLWREDSMYPLKRLIRRPYVDYDVYL